MISNNDDKAPLSARAKRKTLGAFGNKDLESQAEVISWSILITLSAIHIDITVYHA